METLVINRKILPEPIFSRVKSEMVRVSEEGGNVVLSPVADSAQPPAKSKFSIGRLFGVSSGEKKMSRKQRKVQKIIDEIREICGDGRLSSENFIRQKAIEKEMEN